MNTNQQFAIFCAKKCLHLWDAPEEVKDWLNDPKEETAREAAAEAARAAWAARRIAVVAAGTSEAELEARAEKSATWAAKTAAQTLGTTEKELKLEFVSTWSDEQLATTDPDWIEYATIEIMNREH